MDGGIRFLFGLLFLGIGLLNLIRPELGWYLSEGWKFRDVEPSDLALVMARVAGVIAALVGLFLLLSWR